MKPWLTTVLAGVAGFCLAYFKAQIPIPQWAIFGGLFMALLFVCLYIRGHNLIQAELKAEQEKIEAKKNEQDRIFRINAAANEAHMQAMREIQARGISTRRPPLE